MSIRRHLRTVRKINQAEPSASVRLIPPPQAGLNVNHVNAQGQTPLTVAQMNKQEARPSAALRRRRIDLDADTPYTRSHKGVPNGSL